MNGCPPAADRAGERDERPAALNRGLYRAVIGGVGRSHSVARWAAARRAAQVAGRPYLDRARLAPERA